MKKKRIELGRKLFINKETISSLNAQESAKIAGGDIAPSASCPGTICPPKTDEVSVCKCIMTNMNTCLRPGEIC